MFLVVDQSSAHNTELRFHVLPPIQGGIFREPDPGVARYALTPGYFMSRLQREEP